MGGTVRPLRTNPHRRHDHVRSNLLCEVSVVRLQNALARHETGLNRRTR